MFTVIWCALNNDLFESNLFLVVVFGSLAIGFAYLAYLLGGPIVQVRKSCYIHTVEKFI